MEPGKYVWYTNDLRKQPMRVKISRVYVDIHGDVRWIWAETRTGEEVNDFVNMFSKSKPTVYCGM